MEDFMSFLQANSFWLIALGVFLVLSLIGYLAEKNGYKKVKDPEVEKQKEEKKEEKTDNLDAIFEETVKEEEPKVEDTLFSEDPIFSEPVEATEVALEETPVEEAPVVETSEEPVEVEKDSKGKKKKDRKKKKKNYKKEEGEETPQAELPKVEELNLDFEVKPMEEDLNAPLEGTKEEEPVVEAIPEDLYAPLEGSKEVEVLDTPIDAPLPDLDSIKDSNEEITSEDDIWKF